MAYAYQSNGEIPALLFSYYAANKTNNLKTITDPTGLLDAITDPTNEAATNQSIIDLGSGVAIKRRFVFGRNKDKLRPMLQQPKHV